MGKHLGSHSKDARPLLRHCRVPTLFMRLSISHKTKHTHNWHLVVSGVSFVCGLSPPRTSHTVRKLCYQTCGTYWLGKRRTDCGTLWQWGGGGEPPNRI